MENKIEDLIYELERLTNTNSDNIDFNDKETFAIFLHVDDKTYKNTINGISEFATDSSRYILKATKPKNFSELVCVVAMLHGRYVWRYNAEDLIKYKGFRVNEVISNRNDLFDHLIENGIDKDTSLKISEFIAKGMIATKRISDKQYAEVNQQWQEYCNIMKEHHIPEWYIHSAEKIEYLLDKAKATDYAINAFKTAWYKVHYPEAFYQVYFKRMSYLEIKNYYNKIQIKREIARLYDEKEVSENTEPYECNVYVIDKINDLELLLEAYYREIYKEKEEIKDDYNLINSRTIADYCRSIKHMFNIEELAVLVYRNRRMSIDEKIKKYQDLIDHYEDMEVIERINCKHYDSAKTMIREEIKRLKHLFQDFVNDSDNDLYILQSFNQSTQKWEHDSVLRDSKRTFKEIDKYVREYVSNYNDVDLFRIVKKYFGKKERFICSEYIVKNKKIKLIDISDYRYLDIDNIFVDIPTPFKKGDILISKYSTTRNFGDNGDIFVLDYLCTWRKDLKKSLLKGNYDSSDMTGLSYYLYGDDSTEFVHDHKWDYDSFEYYDGKLVGNNRILKDISSFVKGKIGLDLFIHTYEAYQAENKRKLTDFYTDESLKLAGFTDLDILRENHHNEKIYNMSEDEREEYLKRYTCIYEKFKNNIVQIETDFYNNIYVLLGSGVLYKTAVYDAELEKIAEGIIKIHMFDGIHLYRITNEHIILPIEQEYSRWDNIDKYLNNNNCQYKKIETSVLHMVLLTNDGDIRAIHGYSGLGIIPENFKEVDDITIVEDEDGIDMPFIYKNNEYIKLYLD